MLLSARRRENQRVLGVLKNQRVARLHEAQPCQPPKFPPPTPSITTGPKRKLCTPLNMQKKALASMQPRFKEHKQPKPNTPLFRPPRCQDPKSWNFASYTSTRPQKAVMYTQRGKRNVDEKGIRTPALSDQRIGLTLSWRLRPLGHLTIDGEHASAHVQESQHPPMRCSGRRITRAGRIGRVVVRSRIQ